MFDELNEIMKSDPISQDKFKAFKINFRKTVEKNSKGALKRARVTAFVLGSTIVVLLVILLFAFKMKTQADKLQNQVSSLEVKLKKCKDFQNE